jgi:hypothetical protein
VVLENLGLTRVFECHIEMRSAKRIHSSLPPSDGLAVVELIGDAADQGQAEPEAGRVVARRHAAPVVAYDDLYAVIVHGHADGHGSGFRAVTKRVDDGVGDGL